MMPALTKRDWEYISEIPPLHPGDWFEYQFEHDDPGHDRLVISAAMLHKQEFGFTREHVRRLRTAVRCLLRELNYRVADDAPLTVTELLDEGCRSEAKLWELSDLIEAFLPPEGN